MKNQKPNIEMLKNSCITAMQQEFELYKKYYIKDIDRCYIANDGIMSCYDDKGRFKAEYTKHFEYYVRLKDKLKKLNQGIVEVEYYEGVNDDRT